MVEECTEKTDPKNTQLRKMLWEGKVGTVVQNAFYKVMYETEEFLDRDLDW
jgi:hypothetical protein